MRERDNVKLRQSASSVNCSKYTPVRELTRLKSGSDSGPSFSAPTTAASTHLKAPLTWLNSVICKIAWTYYVKTCADTRLQPPCSTSATSCYPPPLTSTMTPCLQSFASYTTQSCDLWLKSTISFNNGSHRYSTMGSSCAITCSLSAGLGIRHLWRRWLGSNSYCRNLASGRYMRASSSTHVKQRCYWLNSWSSDTAKCKSWAGEACCNGKKIAWLTKTCKLTSSVSPTP